MQVTVLQENLLKALSFVGKNVSSKTQLPILSNILLETDKGRLKLSSTNLETSISFWIGATVEKEGEITVPARVFQEVVSSFSQDKVKLKATQSKLLLACGESEVELAGIEAQEFPPLPLIEEKDPLFLETKVFQESLPLVQIATAYDENRPLLTGIRFTKTDEHVDIVATDGYRLSIKKIPVMTGLSTSFVVPGKALQEVYRIIHEQKVDVVKLFFGKEKNQVLFSLPDVYITTRLIEGEYPAYEKIIPQSYASQVIFNKQEFLQAVKMGAIFARDSSNIIRLKIEPGQVIVSANSPQMGHNKNVLSVKTEGEENTIALNVRFLLDLLTVIPEDQVIFEMTQPLSPGVFKLVKDTSFIHIIMPVRVQS